MYRYVIINGFKYAVQQGTYIRKWQRQFTATLVANLVELNFVDRGPGIKTYNFTLILNTWSSDSLPYKDGVTQTVAQQIANLESAYSGVATSYGFTDIFGNTPSSGVYFTNLSENIPNYSTPEKVYVLMDVELINSSAI